MGPRRASVVEAEIRVVSPRLDALSGLKTSLHVDDVATKPEWYGIWEHRRPAWVQECSGEFIGVFIFCYVGLGSTAALTIGENTNQSQLSSVLQIGLAYAFGIAVAIITCGMSSGGHFSPAITVTFSLFKNFPLKKVPLYIASQIAGAFSATLIVYAQYRPYFLEIETRLVAAGKEASLFSSSGPAGVFAIYPNPGVSLGWTFLNEFFANIFIGLVVWACLDPSNVFVTSTSIPAFIGLAWALVIWGFDPATLSTNVARDVGARLGAIAIWGTNAWGGRYGAMSAFTPFLSTFLAACIYEFLLVDTSRVITASAKGLMENNERQRERKAYKCDQGAKEGGQLGGWPKGPMHWEDVRKKAEWNTA